MTHPNDNPLSHANRKFATVLFADIVGYTTMMEADESAALSSLHYFKKALEENAVVHRGEIIQYYGDGCLIVFSGAADGIRYAMGLKEAFEEEPSVPVRIGLHHGEVIEKDGNLYGHTVNLASRIQSLGVPGAVLFSVDVKKLIKGQGDIEAAPLGKFEFKNVAQPMAVFAVANEGFVVPSRTEMDGKLKLPTASKSIAILPFINMSSDLENEYFSDGITEEIINALTRIEALQVTARTSSFAFKNKNLDVREIGTQLGVATILEGSVRMAKKKVRITAQLINVADGFHFWSETFDRSMDDIFAVQDEISLLIAEKLRENMGHFNIGDKLVEAPDVDVETYKMYLKGRFLIFKMNLPDVEKGIRVLEGVIAKQPNFPMPYLAVHNGYSLLGAIGWMPSVDAFAKAKPYLDKAIALDKDLPECQFNQAGISFWQDWDFDATYRHLSKAIEMRPGYAEAYYSMAACYAAEGKYVAATHSIDMALQLDPFSPMNHYIKGVILYLQEKYPAANRCFEKSIEIEPNFVLAKIIWGGSILMQGRLKEALAHYQNLPDNEADLSKLGGVTLAYSKLGEIELAGEGVMKLKSAMQTDVMGRALAFLIMIQTNLGRYEEALDLIEQGIRYKLPAIIYMKEEPILKPLRPFPRFQTLMMQIFGKDHSSGFAKNKYKKSSLKKKDAENYYQHLEKYMAEEKPYLNPNLSLRTLAQLIDIHPNQLSQLLNERVGKNFSEYINQFRLETFKNNAQDASNQHLTILALAYDSGFNSKTVFNTFFKKTMGMTPREYWKEVVK